MGPPGPKGEPGPCACNVSNVFEVARAEQLIQGPKGEPGIQGIVGKQGPMGLTVSRKVYIPSHHY